MGILSPVYFGGYLPQGVNPSNSRSFRANNYDADFPGFEGKDLTATQPLELDPSASVCSDSYLYITVEVEDYE